MNPNNDRVYVPNNEDGTVSVIDGATNTVIATVAVGSAGSTGHVGVNLNNDRVYVAIAGDDTVYVIADATDGATP